MSIHILSTHSKGGGAFVAARALSEALVEYGIETELETLNRTSISDQTIFYTNIVADRIIRKFFRINNPIFHSTGVYGKITSQQLNKSSHDTIHLHWCSNGLIGLQHLSKIKKKLIFTAHDSWMACGFEHHPHGEKFASSLLDSKLFNLKRRAIANCAGIIFPSRWQESVFTRRFDELPRHAVIPNISEIDSDVAATTKRTKIDGDFRIGIACQRALENKAKGAELLLQTLAILNSSNSQTKIRVLIAGTPSRSTQGIQATFSSIDIKELGSVPHNEMAQKFYRHVDILLNLSSIENLSTTLVESAAYSIPCIALNVGGNQEIIDDGRTGFLCPPIPAAISSKILELAGNAHLRGKLAEQAKSKYEQKFSKKQIINDHLKFYAE